MGRRRPLSLLALVLVACLATARCATRQPAAPAGPAVSAPVAAHAAPAPAAPSETAHQAFRADVQPILARRCAPCHEPGGKMYDRLPFDEPDVVRSHAEGILRRIKEPAEKSALEGWLSGG